MTQLKKIPGKSLTFIFLAVSVFFLASEGISWGQYPFTQGTGYAYVELGGGNDPDLIGGSAGIAVKTGPYVAVNGALTFLADDSSDDYYGGFSLGVRSDLPFIVAPFIGVGVFTGYTEKDVPAEDDNIDNDNDGAVDEKGEEKEVIDNVISTFYPEAGLMIYLNEVTRATFTARYNYSSEGREEDFWIYTVGFTFTQ